MSPPPEVPASLTLRVSSSTFARNASATGFST